VTGVAINGVHLRVLRSPVLRILRRSPRWRTARLARTRRELSNP